MRLPWRCVLRMFGYLINLTVGNNIGKTKVVTTEFLGAFYRLTFSLEELKDKYLDR
jgi:hypothetical protein